MRILKSLLVALLLPCLGGCDPSRPAATANIRARLVGTWLGESSDGGIRTRTVIELGEAGGFDEFEKIDDGEGRGLASQASGEWSFDGTTFHRKYTHRQGKPLPLNYFASTRYAIHMTSNDSFVGIDNLRHRSIRFSRVVKGARP